MERGTNYSVTSLTFDWGNGKGEADVSRWRDTGPISARNTSRGGLVREAHAVLRALGAGLSIQEVHAACLNGKLLRQPARASREKVWSGLNWRYFAWHPPAWVIRDFVSAARRPGTDPRLVGLLYLHYARRDRLAYEFVTRFLWPRWTGRQLRVDSNDVLDFLSQDPERADQSRSWTDAGRRKLARNLLSSLRDFGLLRGSRQKEIQRPIVAPEVTRHLARLLFAEGLRGRALLEAEDWRLFLWDDTDVADAFAKLAQEGLLRFERVGRTVILEIPDTSWELS